ncbi:MFS transporter [Desertimonas flava]|uniref:MFS transporter n=1 Tax=Desertimonas flava TaxID=2064846 RepID=UPI000E35309A|nr:MFS transporter [Desertimonas flava]
MLTATAAEPTEAPARLVTRPFVAVTMAVFAFFVYVGVLVPIIPTYVEDEMRGGELGVGLAIAAFAGAAIAVRPLIGRLIDRFGRRALMIGGSLLAAVVGSMYGFVDSLPALLVLRGLTGIGEAALFVGAATLVADLAPAHRQAEASSYFSVAVYGGIGVGPLLGDLVMDHNGFREAFILAAGCAALAAGLSVAVPKWVRGVSSTSPVEGIDSGSIDLDGTGRAAFIHPAALAPGLVLAVGMAAYSTFSAFLPDHSRSLGMSGSGGLFTTYSLVCLALRVAGARVPERLGPRTSVTVAFTALGGGLALLAAVPQQWALWVAAGLVGCGMAFLYPSLMALTVNRASDRDRARAISSFTMFFEIGTAVGGLTLGALADALGKRVGFGSAVALCVFGVWMLWTVTLPRPAATPALTVPAGAGPAFVPVCGE